MRASRNYRPAFPHPNALVTVAVADLSTIAEYIDRLLGVRDTPDYPGALNGLQVSHNGPVLGIAAAVDASLRSIVGARDAGANLLVVHHGLFWAGAQRLEGRAYDRMRHLLTHDIAVYSAHLPLDAHPTYGNSRLLAQTLGLTPTDGFARHESIWCGVRGQADVATSDIHERLRSFARGHGGDVVATPYDLSQRTRRWAICTGSGANANTLQEAISGDIDTLIVGEGPHWTAVDAIDSGITVLYGGHYATETLGVQALADHVAGAFNVPWTFVPAPTGL
jgi:dinuclear metal center YbgI/SA1388 family protein